ncbi:MAG: glycosyltransferase family 39 protein [Planctomycetota bacterium]
MAKSKIHIAFGLVLIAVGLLTPSSTVLELLVPQSPGYEQENPAEQLLLGATLFKISILILGLLVIALGRLVFQKHPVKVDATPSGKYGRHRLVAVIGILLVASILRLYGLNYGLWYDEIMTYVNHFRNPYGEIITSYDSLNQHCLYSLLAHTSFLVFGDSAWSLRIPAVVFGVGSLWALYLFGRQVASEREALLAVLLLAFSYHHIWFSQNARGYTALLFFTLLASWIFLRGLQESVPRTWLSYAIVVALGVYTHITMFFVIIGHFIIYVISLLSRHKETWPGKWSGGMLGFGLAGFFTFQLYSLVLPQMLGNVVTEKSTVAGWNNPFWTILEFAKGFELSFGGGLAAIVALVVFGIGTVSFVREKPIVIGMLFIPAIICIMVVTMMVKLLFPRFLFFTVGFGVLVVIRGVVVLGEMTGRLLRVRPTISASIGPVLCVAMIVVSAMSLPSAYGPKQDYEGALSFVRRMNEPGDTIVTAGLAAFPYNEFYKTNWEVVETLDTLRDIRANSKRTWLLYTIPLHLRSVYPEMMDYVVQEFQVVKQFHGTLGGGTIFVCLSQAPSS